MYNEFLVAGKGKMAFIEYTLAYTRDRGFNSLRDRDTEIKNGFLHLNSVWIQLRGGVAWVPAVDRGWIWNLTVFLFIFCVWILVTDPYVGEHFFSCIMNHYKYDLCLYRIQLMTHFRVFVCDCVEFLVLVLIIYLDPHCEYMHFYTSRP